MATKADFSETEWQAMQRGVTGAGMLVSVSDQDLSDSFGESSAMAKYLSAQKFVRAKQPFDAAKAQRGSSVYKLRCEKCHENNGASPDEDNGILAGQWMPYLRDQLAGFRSGRRPLDDKMKQRLDRVNNDEEEALLHFFASQQ